MPRSAAGGCAGLTESAAFNVVSGPARGYNALVRWLIKWLLRLASVLVLLAVLLFLFKDSILRVVAEQRLRSRTGLDVQIGRFSSGLFSPEVTLRDLKLYNTAEFGGTLFLNVPELHIEFDPDALARHQLHITLMRFNLAEFDVVRNDAGQTNIYSILNKVRGDSSGQSHVPNLLKDLQFTGIDVLNLTLGKAKYIDLKEQKNNRELRVGLQNQIFRGVKSDADLYGILFMIWLRSGGGFTLSPADLTRLPGPGQPAPDMPALEKPAPPRPKQ
jgi:hypothetical protein